MHLVLQRGEEALRCRVVRGFADILLKPLFSSLLAREEPAVYDDLGARDEGGIVTR